MYMSEVNYKSPASSPTEDASFSDVENFAISPEDHKIDVVNVEQLSIDERISEKEIRSDESRSWTMAKVQVGYDVTRKGERSLVVDGFKFTKSRDGTNNRVFWRCSRRECKATAVTVCDRVEHVRAIHAHEPPLAAEFFGNHEGVSQHCELQEVRFNTNAANMRPRYRRSNMSLSESNPEETMRVKDISNSANNLQKNPAILQQQKSYSVKIENNPTPFHTPHNDIRPTSTSLTNQPKTPSVKDQVRDFILRNSSQINNYPQNHGVSVAQFLISPSTKSPFVLNNVPSPTPLSSSVFNFNPMQINALSNNNGSDSTSDISSHKSTPGLMTVPTTPHEDTHSKTQCSDNTVLNQMHVDQIIQLLLKRSTTRPGSSSDSEWSSPTLCPEVQQRDVSPPVIVSSGVNDGYAANATSRFVHWKKERLRESEMSDQLVNDRKRRYEDYSGVAPEIYQDSRLTRSYTPPPETDSKQLGSFLNNFRPTITHKLMGVMQKLTSELCPEEAIAQEVYEKCTAIKTCLETLEKLHSLTSL